MPALLTAPLTSSQPCTPPPPSPPPTSAVSSTPHGISSNSLHLPAYGRSLGPTRQRVTATETCSWPCSTPKVLKTSDLLPWLLCTGLFLTCLLCTMQHLPHHHNRCSPPPHITAIHDTLPTLLTYTSHVIPPGIPNTIPNRWPSGVVLALRLLISTPVLPLTTFLPLRTPRREAVLRSTLPAQGLPWL